MTFHGVIYIKTWNGTTSKAFNKRTHVVHADREKATLLGRFIVNTKNEKTKLKAKESRKRCFVLYFSLVSFSKRDENCKDVEIIIQ